MEPIVAPTDPSPTAKSEAYNQVANGPPVTVIKKSY